MKRFMLASYLTPRFVGYCLTGEVLLLLGLYLVSSVGRTPRLRVVEAIIMTVSGLAAYGIAMLLSFEIASEYRRSPWARAAWLLLATSAAISLLKRSAGTPLIDFVDASYRTGPLRGLVDNLMVVPANLCLFAGLVALWWGIHRIGLGFRIGRRDWTVMAGVAALFVMLLVFREDLSQGRSPYLLSRILQPVGLGLLGLACAFGVVLHRYAVLMGDGRLAAVMRWLMVYVLMRGGLVLIRAAVAPSQPVTIDPTSTLNDWTFELLWQIVHWTMAMAAACRAQLTISALAELKKLRTAKSAAVPV
ncbi:MAG: hypothetical protein AB7H86_18225 [Blastocatellales bacterium]